MARKLRRMKSRLFDPTPDELWWLSGKPFPYEPPGVVRQELGLGARIAGRSEVEKAGLNPFAVIQLSCLRLAGPRTVNRLRELCENAPESVQIAPERRAVLETGDIEAHAGFERHLAAQAYDQFINQIESQR